jgi:hypothetical protein
MAQIGEMEHPTCTRPEEERHDGDDVRMDAQPVPQEGKHQANGTREVNIQPLLRVLRLERNLQQFSKCRHLNYQL